MKSKFVLIGFLCVLFFLFQNCTKKTHSKKWQGTIEDKEGVKVVKNPKEPMYGEDVFSLEEELSIGEKEGKEEYMFSHITDIGVDEEERIYILDSKELHIKVFNKMGKYIKTIGKKESFIP